VLFTLSVVVLLVGVCPDGSLLNALDRKGATERSIRILQDFERKSLEFRWPGDKPQVFRVLLDDSPSFRRPIFSREVDKNRLVVNWLEEGLAPWVTYYVRVQAAPTRRGTDSSMDELSTAFRVLETVWPESYLNYAYVRKAWETAGRTWVHQYSGVKWNEASTKWEVDPQWPYSASEVAPQAYYLEYATRGAVNMALTCRDIGLLDELSQFFVVYSNRFTTLGDMRRQNSPLVNSNLLNGQGRDSARTLIWIEKQSLGTSRIREHTLANSQFFHPAARLIRGITLLPTAERTATMAKFISVYADLIVHDHLMRLLYEAEWDYWGARDLPKHLVDIWRTIANSQSPAKFSYQHAMLDRDLWLIATTAEILGANANDPHLVPLDAGTRRLLLEAVQVGVQLFETKRTLYPDTKTFQGETVGSASYFNGDLADHEGLEFSGYEGESFPTEHDKQIYRRASWDISHSYRLPVFIRSLYDNKKATEVNFPSAHDVVLVTNQLMYRVFRADFEHPLFNNLFDGSNGWVDVSPNGTATPPAQYCNTADPKRHCLLAGAVQGWGLIAFFNPDLMRLEHSMATLAWRDDPQAKAFRDRYYYYDGATFSFRDAHHNAQYPTLLFWVLSGMPASLQGCLSK
jgi:hypothetical protein